MSGKLFAVPNLDARDEVMLPPEHVKWFTAEPESVLSIHRVRDVRHSLKHLRIGLDDKAITHFLTRIVNDSLSKNLDLMHESMYSEICTAVQGTLAKCDDSWQPFNVYNTVRDINSKVMARLMFGSPICHDEEFLASYHGFLNTIGISVMVIGQLPAVLRGLVGPFFSIPLWYFNRRLQKVVLPVVRKRLSRVEDPVGDENDVLAECIKSTLKDEALRKESSAEMLIQQTLGLAFSSTFPTSSHLAHMVLDLVSCSSFSQVYQELRTEVEAVFKSEEDWSNAAKLKELVLMNSAIRESLRLHPPLINGLTREVVRPGGLELPGGTRVPRGTWVGVPIYSIHTDSRFYSDPKEYQPFRFVESSNPPSVPENQEDEKRQDGRRLHAGQTTDRYLGWGYGRGACPGRWLVVHLTQLIMAKIILDYDMEAIEAAPDIYVLGDSPMPPLSQTIMLRRRQSALKC
ncbi:hypothetical protein NQ176_g2278 [Zarea fungicola]|uniref:Uncharacterized protein n=1 Tax=Zarea fungicola TaxID=93591 RepID=A0ACC1NQ22_9HYPO|nr:hypothetical protein NQ176_g2278 [Lecanicillium fungicola]